METIFIEMNYLGESSQQELEAYRKVGSVRTLKRLKQKEVRRLNRIRRAVKALKNLFFGACCAFDIWVFISWVDIILHNTNPNPVYQAWNFFTLFI